MIFSELLNRTLDDFLNDCWKWVIKIKAMGQDECLAMKSRTIGVCYCLWDLKVGEIFICDL